MAPEGTFGTPGGTLPHDPPTGWHDGRPRATLMCFVDDAVTESALRDGLSGVTPERIEFRRGGIRAAINQLRRVAPPRHLIVDIGGEEQPLSPLAELSQGVEPDVQLLLIGDLADVDFYLVVTQGQGAREYLHKPIKRDRVAQLF